MQYEVVIGWTAPIDIVLLSKGQTPSGTMVGMTAALILQDQTGTILPTTSDVTIPDTSQWIVRYTPDSADLIEGTYRGRVRVTDGSGGIAFFPSGEPDTWIVRKVAW
jgi:hypothetical protein